MSLVDDLDSKTSNQIAKSMLDREAQRIVNKGADMSTADLYNLCLVNREKDEMIKKEEKSCEEGIK